MGGFYLTVELHREGSALQPAQQACFYNLPNLTVSFQSSSAKLGNLRAFQLEACQLEGR